MPLLSAPAGEPAVQQYLGVLIPHTHWDRAWYLPFEQFRLRLLALTERLLEILDSEPGFRFTFDGQSVVLEDVLEIHPEWEERLRRHVSSGRLAVGPWYVLPDEFLVSGEALIRNLLIGRQVASRLGRAARVGYLPDPFGHIAQMPQILAGFGIPSFVFSRGLGDEGETLGSEFWWVAPDGQSRVLAHHQIGGYCNAAGLGLDRQDRLDPDKGRRQLAELADRLKPCSRTGVLYLSNGCDHLFPQAGLEALLEGLPADLRVQLGTVEDFFQEVQARNPSLGSYQGELRSGRYHNLLPSVFSARLYLKQANARCQHLLERWVEPFCTLAEVVAGQPYPAAEIRYAWKKLLQNQPHDDICGCSVDEVHREDLVRFDQVRQVGETLTLRALEALAGSIDRGGQAAPVVVVFNPLPWERHDALEATLPPRVRALRTADGRPVPVQELGRGRVLLQPGPVPSLGYITLYPEKKRRRLPAGVTASGRRLENDLLRVEVAPNGTLKITDRRSGLILPGLNLLESCEDAGDEYDWSPAPHSRTLTSARARPRLKVVERGPVRAALEIRYDLELPEGLSADRRRRARQKVVCPIWVRVSLVAGSPRVDIELSGYNRARDHRLRAVFPTPLRPDRVQVEEHFQVLERPLEQPAGKDWVQPPYGVDHQESFLSLHDGKLGFSLLNAGLPEYEARRHRGGTTVYLTLLRSVGWLSRSDLATRRGHAGPEMATPEAQCLGPFRAHYALMVHPGDWRSARVLPQAYQLNLPMRLLTLEGGPAGPATLPPRASFLSVQPEHVVVSAVKKAENGQGVIVRTWSSGEGDASLSFWTPPRQAWLCDLAERRQEPLSLQSDTLRVPAEPWRLVTVEAVF